MVKRVDKVLKVQGLHAFYPFIAVQMWKHAEYATGPKSRRTGKIKFYFHL
jgi:hypothetical protein